MIKKSTKDKENTKVTSKVKSKKKDISLEQEEIKEKVIHIDRVARVVKGGRRFRFRATVVVGDKKGKVGIGVGKGTVVHTAVEKAKNKALKNIISIPLVSTTIPHEIMVNFGSARVFLKPASCGTGVIAGGAVRAVLEMAGIKDILSKILGSSSKINNTKACFLALKRLKDPRSLARLHPTRRRIKNEITI